MCPEACSTENSLAVSPSQARRWARPEKAQTEPDRYITVDLALQRHRYRTGLSAAVSGTTATLSWGASSDSKTPAPGLTYNLRVGTTPGGSDVVSPMALGSGYREIPALGNVNQNRAWAVKSLKPGTY